MSDRNVFDQRAEEIYYKFDETLEFWKKREEAFIAIGNQFPFFDGFILNEKFQEFFIYEEKRIIELLNKHYRFEDEFKEGKHTVEIIFTILLFKILIYRNFYKLKISNPEPLYYYLAKPIVRIGEWNEFYKQIVKKWNFYSDLVIIGFDEEWVWGEQLAIEYYRKNYHVLSKLIYPAQKTKITLKITENGKTIDQDDFDIEPLFLSIRNDMVFHGFLPTKVSQSIHVIKNEMKKDDEELVKGMISAAYKFLSKGLKDYIDHLSSESIVSSKTPKLTYNKALLIGFILGECELLLKENHHVKHRKVKYGTYLHDFLHDALK